VGASLVWEDWNRGSYEESYLLPVAGMVLRWLAWARNCGHCTIKLAAHLEGSLMH